jgi:hypothetical protein
MANTIRLKRKSTTGAPANGDLVEGELAINTFDQKLYSKDATTIFEIGELTDTLGDVTARGATTATNIITSNATPAYIWNETAAALDEKNWWTVASGGNFLLAAINDVFSVTDNVMLVSRTGVNVDEINFYTDGGTERLSVETSGIIVTGTVAATTVTGANVTSGVDPGHTHTSASISGWVMKTATYTLVAGDKINVTATSGTATIEPPATLVAGDSFQVHNDTTSTQTVQINPQTGQTIRGAGSSVTAADNMILIPGDTAHFIAVSTTVMEVV